MSAHSPASARRATLDAIALALAFLAVDALIVVAVIADLVDGTQAIVTVLALGAVVLLLYRDDVMDALAAGNERLGLHTDEGVRWALDALARDGWTVEHDVVRGTSGRLDHLVDGPNGAFVVVTRHRAYRVEHLGRARHHAARMHTELGRWVTPVICLTMRDDTPHRRDGVWIMGAEHLVGWLRSRSDGRATRES
ncbi:MAG TPA: hypothetical protein VFR63_13755 [Gaiellaceae bacterium]|nr:hypothetical protein [Gaiellaceae bacterium]